MQSGIKLILIGNCGRDPEIRYLPSGQAVANVSIATSTRRKNRDTGESVEDTQWHRVTFYDRLAEIAGEYVKKGRPIYVEGRLKYGTYVDKAAGDKVSAATANQSGFLRCEATRVGEDTTLAQIIRMVSDAAATKAPIAKIADTVSGFFVPAVQIDQKQLLKYNKKIMLFLNKIVGEICLQVFSIF
jgi:single stranded DNA-binding protein